MRFVPLQSADRNVALDGSGVRTVIGVIFGVASTTPVVIEEIFHFTFCNGAVFAAAHQFGECAQLMLAAALPRRPQCQQQEALQRQEVREVFGVKRPQFRTFLLYEAHLLEKRRVGLICRNALEIART